MKDFAQLLYAVMWLFTLGLTGSLNVVFKYIEEQNFTTLQALIFYIFAVILSFITWPLTLGEYINKIIGG